MLELRPATDNDFEYARRVHHSAYREMVIAQFGKWEEQVQDHFFEKSWNHAPYSIIVVAGEPCGYCCIKETQDAVQLLEFAVDPEKQGRGTGSQLLAKFRDIAKRKQKTAQLNVMKTNEKAKSLYEKLGFNVYGENQNQFLMHNINP